MTELGYDWKRCDTSYGKHMQGAAVNYTTGSADYKASPAKAVLSVMVFPSMIPN